MKKIVLLGAAILALVLWGNSNKSESVDPVAIIKKQSEQDAQTIASIIYKNNKLVSAGTVNDTNANIIYDICDNIGNLDAVNQKFNEITGKNFLTALKSVFESTGQYAIMADAITAAQKRQAVIVGSGRSVYTYLRESNGTYTGDSYQIGGVRYVGRIVKNLGSGIYSISRYDSNIGAFRTLYVSKLDIVLI